MKLLSSFTKNTDSGITRAIVKFVLAWYLIDTILFFIVGLSEENIQTILTGIFLVFWFILTIILYNETRKIIWLVDNFSKIYLLLIFVLATLEETLVFLNGGGLGGKATSLTQDLFLAVPVFVGIALGILILDHWIPLTNGEIFVLGAIQGFLVELVISGNLALVWFLGGPALGIYGMMMSSFSKDSVQDETKKSLKYILIIFIVGSVLCYGGAILGAIIGDTLYRAII